jgi:RNA polymerase sigma-70 factor (ECF subfamily)
MPNGHEERRRVTGARALAADACHDDEALARLMREYHDRVYRFGMRVCRDGFDADDAVQEAFTKLARRPDVARAPSALSWLLSVVRNACLRMLRPFARERRTLGERIADADAVPTEALDPEAALARWQLCRAVHDAIATLDGPQREALILRDLEGLSGQQAAETLGLTEAAMKTRLHRARAEVRRALERSGEAPSTRPPGQRAGA